MDLIQIYLWGRPREVIKTVNGSIRYSQYLAIQEKRLSKNPNRIVEIRKTEYDNHKHKKDKHIALFVTPYCEIYGCHDLAVKSIQTSDGLRRCCEFHSISANRPSHR